MKLIIRLVWLGITLGIYYFIDTGLTSAGMGMLIKTIVFFVYFTFVVFIPSNAMVAMWNKKQNGNAKPAFDRTKSKVLMCQELSKYMYNTANDFLTKENIALSATNRVYVWCAFIASLKDKIDNEIIMNMDTCFRKTFAAYSPTIMNEIDPLVESRNDIMRSLVNSKPAQSAEWIEMSFDTLMYYTNDFEQSERSIESSTGKYYKQCLENISTFFESTFKNVK